MEEAGIGEGSKIHLQFRRPLFDSWVRKIPWKRDRLPILVYLGFPGGSAGKESACHAGDLGSIPGLGRSPGEGNSYPLQYSIDGDIYRWHSSWGCKESDRTEQLSLSLSRDSQRGREEGTSTSHAVLVANKSPFVCSWIPSSSLLTRQSPKPPLTWSRCLSVHMIMLFCFLLVLPFRLHGCEPVSIEFVSVLFIAYIKRLPTGRLHSDFAMIKAEIWIRNIGSSEKIHIKVISKRWVLCLQQMSFEARLSL